MKSSQELLDERRVRIRNAVALESVDRTPVVLLSDAFFARQVGVKMADFCKTLQSSNLAIAEGCKQLGDIDGTDFAFAPTLLFTMDVWIKMRLPGVRPAGRLIVATG